MRLSDEELQAKEVELAKESFLLHFHEYYETLQKIEKLDLESNFAFLCDELHEICQNQYLPAKNCLETYKNFDFSVKNPENFKLENLEFLFQKLNKMP